MSGRLGGYVAEMVCLNLKLDMLCVLGFDYRFPRTEGYFTLRMPLIECAGT